MKKTNNKQNKFIGSCKTFADKCKDSWNNFLQKSNAFIKKVQSKLAIETDPDKAKNKAHRNFIKFNNGFKKSKNRIPEFNILMVMILLFIILWIAEPKFASWLNISNLLCQSAITGVIAVGMTFIIVSAGIDLSVGSILALAGIMTAKFIMFGMPIWFAIILSVLISVVLGFLAGFLIHKGHIPPFIATLGTMVIVRGIVMLVSDARTIQIPKSFLEFSMAKWLGIPAMVWIWFAIIIIGVLLAKYTRFGRNVYAIGSNEEAARLSGVNVGATLCGVYAFGALCAAVAGVLTMTRLGVADPTAGTGSEMDAIAAVVVGGASLSGAVGSVGGTVIGTIIIAMIRNGGQLLRMNTYGLNILVGALIVVAVLIDKLGAKRKNK